MLAGSRLSLASSCSGRPTNLTAPSVGSKSPTLTRHGGGHGTRLVGHRLALLSATKRSCAGNVLRNVRLRALNSHEMTETSATINGVRRAVWSGANALGV